MIVALGKIFTVKKVPVAPAIPSASSPASVNISVDAQDDEDEVIAAIMAAVYACGVSPSSNLVVRPMVCAEFRLEKRVQDRKHFVSIIKYYYNYYKSGVNRT
jgi:hypothetical protein